ncbi:MAG: S-adenosylmethionine synthetase [Euryarchaeota archaeon CG01_land_8_20_14_3_00_38_12]|nr:MAG: S-adenosylmethionine synthetase [Euryarchaeota archaeon CG01_land_8_20_14_3_00_38_12]
MARNIEIEKINYTPIEKQNTELVERKGIGHPDSIADGIAETVSRALSKYYLENYGSILHHNTDECQIVGGQSAPKFGGGVVLEPAEVILVGRAVTDVNDERLPIRSTAIKAARDYMKKNFMYLNVDTDVTFDCKIGKGSVDLRGLYESKKLLANDTSFGIGYAPFSETEKIVLETAKMINGKLKKKIKGIGEDIKVMAGREKNKINLTIAAAMVGSEIPDIDHYISVKEELKNIVHDNALKYTDREVNVYVNTGDDIKRSIYYLTVTGLSMENGDDGSVGRGNRANGLITPNRPMSMEASAGKNPVTHVGKIYNILAFRIANEIVKLSSDINEAQVRLLSQIGKPIDKPEIASVQLIMNGNLNKVEKDVYSVVDEKLENITDVTKDIVNGKVSVF